MKYFAALLAHLRLTAGFDHEGLKQAQTELAAFEAKIEELEARLVAVEQRPPVHP